MNETEKIAMDTAISEFLGFRHSAKHFFSYLDSHAEKDVILDFENVVLMSRSFAHEYQKRKGEIDKNIKEINVPKNINEMLLAVENPGNNSK